MRDDIPQAALALLCALPVHRHEGTYVQPEYRPRSMPRTSKAVMIDGTEYMSISHAAHELGTDNAKIRRMIGRGEGRYV